MTFCRKAVRGLRASGELNFGVFTLGRALVRGLTLEQGSQEESVLYEYRWACVLRAKDHKNRLLTLTATMLSKDSLKP